VGLELLERLLPLLNAIAAPVLVSAIPVGSLQHQPDCEVGAALLWRIVLQVSLLGSTDAYLAQLFRRNGCICVAEIGRCGFYRLNSASMMRSVCGHNGSGHERADVAVAVLLRAHYRL
jgi:hypothetical protein